MPDLFFLHDDVVQHFLLVDKTGLQFEQGLNQQADIIMVHKAYSCYKKIILNCGKSVIISPDPGIQYKQIN